MVMKREEHGDVSLRGSGEAPLVTENAIENMEVRGDENHEKGT
jgi:hypothetical protein